MRICGVIREMLERGSAGCIEVYFFNVLTLAAKCGLLIATLRVFEKGGSEQFLSL
jgi:hypothetical protein